ncbi:hypothetical protein [Nocardiopsis aegyptia]|uniref:Uncharacterized protein n=1 Tax=Nocardiopsis aegyptia TaxID=220378 RepID=A0A7Z0EMN4_9ACTN|nr:hypothetical protein [Nocardiopsis aegyptia]NYJ34942.1 hypothetical protein [Nocardiopsis aegyptia]
MTMATAASALAPDMRRVLNAPRGQRFSRPTTVARPSTAPAPPLASLGRTPRERALLAHMPDTPRLRHRLAHGDLPLWMAGSDPQNPRPRREPGRTGPSPDSRPGDGPAPGPEPVRIPRPRRERPPLPRRSDRPRRPTSHRRPRRGVGWPLVGYVLATMAGILMQYFTGVLG